MRPRTKKKTDVGLDVKLVTRVGLFKITRKLHVIIEAKMK